MDNNKAMRALCVCILLLASGCATVPVATSAAREVPKDRMLNGSMSAPQAGYGKVIIKRDGGLSASACNTRIYANGVAVAEIGPGEKVTIYLPEGDQMLAAKAAGICAGGLVEAAAKVSVARPAIYRVSYGTWGEFSLQPTAF